MIGTSMVDGTRRWSRRGWILLACAGAAALSVAAPGPVAAQGGPPDLPLRTFVARPGPDMVEATPWLFSRGSKDVQRTYDTKRKKIIVGTGDYNGGREWQNSGHNSIFEYDAVANTWGLTATNCQPPGQVSPGRPTDRGLFVFDSKRNAIWLWSLIDTVKAGDTCDKTPPGSGSVFTKGLLKYDLATKVWTKEGPGARKTMSMGAYDATDDAIVYVTEYGNCPSFGWAMVTMSLTTFSTTGSASTCYAPSPAFAGRGGWTGAPGVWQSAFAWDAAGRRAFVCGAHSRLDAPGTVVEKKYSCHRYDHAAKKIVRIADPPAPKPGVHAASYYVHLAYDSVNQRVLWPVTDNPCGQIKQMLVYDPAADTWEDIPIVGQGTSDIRGTLSVFDEAANLLFVASTGFCEPPLPNQTPPFVWRYK